MYSMKYYNSKLKKTTQKASLPKLKESKTIDRLRSSNISPSNLEFAAHNALKPVSDQLPMD